jgi:hypothetical protein
VRRRNRDSTSGLTLFITTEQRLVPTPATMPAATAQLTPAPPPTRCELVARRPPAVREAEEVRLQTACARFRRARRRRPWPRLRPIFDLCAGDLGVSGWPRRRPAPPPPPPARACCAPVAQPGNARVDSGGDRECRGGSSRQRRRERYRGRGEVRPGVNVRNEERVREVRRIGRELAAARPRPGSKETKFQSVRPEPRSDFASHGPGW